MRPNCWGLFVTILGCGCTSPSDQEDHSTVDRASESSEVEPEPQSTAAPIVYDAGIPVQTDEKLHVKTAIELLEELAGSSAILVSCQSATRQILALEPLQTQMNIQLTVDMTLRGGPFPTGTTTVVMAAQGGCRATFSPGKRYVIFVSPSGVIVPDAGNVGLLNDDGSLQYMGESIPPEVVNSLLPAIGAGM